MNKDLLQTIIAMALAAISAIAAISLMGIFWKDSQDTAVAAKVIGEGSHLAGAIDAYVIENYSAPSSLSEILDPRYTKNGASFNWTYDSTSNISYTTVSKENQCKIINKNLGYEGGVPSCSSIPTELSGESFYCCSQ